MSAFFLRVGRGVGVEWADEDGLLAFKKITIY